MENEVEQDILKFGIIAKKETNFSNWYTQVLVKSGMIEYYDVRGCYIMLPSACFAWGEIRKFIDTRIRKMGVEEYYFPLLVTEANMEKEKSHIENFAPELAWVTRSGHSEISPPLAIRPTSEAIIYPYFKRWIRSHRDLPLKANQWCNVLRWEVKSTLPFLRAREFLWQEGHCCYETRDECESEVMACLNIYEEVYNKLLALPVIKGTKSENEKFGGAEYTLSIECFIPESGRGVQGATSHYLGRSFSKMFDVKFAPDDYVYQSSWGLTTRSIGVAIMLHSDNKGLVLPPSISMYEVVIVPCGQLNEDVVIYIRSIEEQLDILGLRYKSDFRDNHNSGYKFNYWEQKGTPLRIEVGKRDAKNQTFEIYERFSGEKSSMVFGNLSRIPELLIDINSRMFSRQKDRLLASIVDVSSFSDFLIVVNELKIAKIDWCGNVKCEEDIKTKSAVIDPTGAVETMGAKSLCIPFGCTEDELGINCIACGVSARCKALFARTY